MADNKGGRHHQETRAARRRAWPVLAGDRRSRWQRPPLVDLPLHPGTARPCDMGLGSADGLRPERSAGRARQVAQEDSKRGGDPIEARKTEQTAPPTAMSFDECNRAYVEAHGAAWKDRTHWELSMARHVSPAIGAMSVSVMATPDVVRVLQPIWLDMDQDRRQAAQPHRAGARLGARRRTSGRREPREVARAPRQVAGTALKGRQDETSPRPAVHRDRHVHGRATGARGSCRPGAAFFDPHRRTRGRGARLDLGRIRHRSRLVDRTSSSRMKGGREHRVPLSPAACDIIRAARDMAHGSKLVFPNLATGGRLSEQALGAVLLRMKHSGITIHGFRSCFRDWAGEFHRLPAPPCRDGAGPRRRRRDRARLCPRRPAGEAAKPHEHMGRILRPTDVGGRHRDANAKGRRCVTRRLRPKQRASKTPLRTHATDS